MTPVTPAGQPLELLEVEVLAAFLFADQRPLVGAAGLLDWRLDGEVTRMLLAGRINGNRGEQLVLRAGGKLKTQWVLLIGAGKRLDCSDRQIKTLLKELWKCCSGAGFKQVGVGLPLDFQASLSIPDDLGVAADELHVQVMFVDDATMA